MWACLNIEYCFPLECSQFDAYLIFKQRTWGTANLRQIETAFSLHADPSLIFGTQLVLNIPQCSQLFEERPYVVKSRLLHRSSKFSNPWSYPQFSSLFSGFSKSPIAAVAPRFPCKSPYLSSVARIPASACHAAGPRRRALMQMNPSGSGDILVGGFNPSEKYESQLG